MLFAMRMGICLILIWQYSLVVGLVFRWFYIVLFVIDILFIVNVLNLFCFTKT